MSQFAERFPGIPIYHGWSQTRDGAIPWRLFLLHMREIGVLEARDLVWQSVGIALALRSAFGPDEKLRDVMDTLRGLAHLPDVTDA